MCQQFPKEEKYRLSDQMIRASRSATACIAEGYGRFHFKGSIQFCRQARGSLYELIDHIEVAAECGHLGPDATQASIARVKKAIWILNGDIKYLNSRRSSSIR